MAIYFIRHGQSEFNAAAARGETAPDRVDAPLTGEGRRQAIALKPVLADLGIRHVISSPLTRAIQTALCAFEDLAPITVAAGHHEKLCSRSDVGRTPAELQRDFPGLSFRHLADKWWYQGSAADGEFIPEPEDVFAARIRSFERSLLTITRKPVAIVGHGLVFKAITGRIMDNCELFQFDPQLA